jgi:hypothetical protein
MQAGTTIRCQDCSLRPRGRSCYRAPRGPRDPAPVRCRRCSPAPTIHVLPTMQRRQRTLRPTPTPNTSHQQCHDIHQTRTYPRDQPEPGRGAVGSVGVTRVRDAGNQPDDRERHGRDEHAPLEDLRRGALAKQCRRQVVEETSPAIRTYPVHSCVLVPAIMTNHTSSSAACAANTIRSFAAGRSAEILDHACRGEPTWVAPQASVMSFDEIGRRAPQM